MVASRSLSRWASSGKAMTGHVRCLVTECMEGRAMLTRETCPMRGKGWAGVRASVVARKRGNSRGAKGCRKVDME